MATKVNGAFTNPRYVTGAMKGTRDYMANKVNPVLVGALSEVARCKPASPKAFLIDVLRTGKAPEADESKGDDSTDFEAAFASLNETMASLMKKLMVDQPEDVKGYVCDFLEAGG